MLTSLCICDSLLRDTEIGVIHGHQAVIANFLFFVFKSLSVAVAVAAAGGGREQV